MGFELFSAPDGVTLGRDLVSEFGWNTTCYQILNEGIERWIDRDIPAIVGSVKRHGCQVVAGAPVCPPEKLQEVIVKWEAHAKQHGSRVCFFGAEAKVLEATRALGGHSEVVLGAQPNWNPQVWEDTTCRHASFRAQLNRSRNKGVTIAEWPLERAQNNPEMRRILREWLQSKGLPAMHFLVEPETLGNLEGRRVFVAEVASQPVAFLVLSPIPCRNGFLTEQFPRSHKAPNGTVELLMDCGIRAVAAAGATYVTMGIVPLSRRGLEPNELTEPELLKWKQFFDIPDPSRVPNPVWLNAMLGWVRAHGRRFYNFDGLEAFKSKFWPNAWEPIYAISNEPKFSFSTLYAIAAAFSDRSPVSSAVRALAKAARQEARWAMRK